MRITDTHVYFWSGPFSNWTDARFVDPVNDHLLFYNSEQAFMWWKAVFFGDHEIATLLEQEMNPGQAKKMGRMVKGFDSVAWSCVDEGYMTYVNYLKYSQNPELKKVLLDTGNRVLVEASPLDRIWGVGLSEDDSRIDNEANWEGLNKLGKCLMRVREMLTVK